MNETPEERARRLGLVPVSARESETPEERARRLGLVPTDGMTELMGEQGLLNQAKPDALKLDVRQPAESTFGLPYDPKRPGDLEAIKSIPAGLKVVGPEAAKGAATLALSASQAIPGMERFQAGMGALGDLTYDESLEALRGETSKIPPEVRIASQVMTGAGAAKALTKLPKVGNALRAPATAGATFGAADQALSADRMSLEERLGRTAAGGVVGGAAGAILDDLITAGRAMTAKPVAANTLAREEAMLAADKGNYGAFAKEAAAAGGTTPEIRVALDHPVIKGYVADLRALPKYAAASDAELLRAAHRRMGADQGGKLKALKREYNSKVADEADALADAKEVALKASESLSGSLRHAVGQHAAREREIRAVKRGAEAGRRTFSRTSPNASAKGSPEALRRDAREGRLSLEERVGATEGALGNLRDAIGVQPNLPSMGGLLTTAIRPMRVAPLLRDLATPNQVLLDDLVRAGLLTSTGAVP